MSPPVSPVEEPTSTVQILRPRVRVRRPGRLRLHLRGPDEEATHEIEVDGARVLVGRSPLADIVLEHESISKFHFSLELPSSPECRAESGALTGVILRDLGSTNGTWYGGRRIEGMILEPGDSFSAGACHLRLLEVGEIEVDTLLGEHFGQLHGGSLAMRELYAELGAIGPTALDVLITGETGTGKELAARTLHALSPRARGPFVILDCGTLAHTLADASLFGFARGAFTGAERDTAGAFEQAQDGTIFIDEIGDLPRELQLKLLGILERRALCRLGEPGLMRRVDLRVLAATHHDLRRAVAEGSFREDLYYRLSRAPIELPPLRDRGEDIVLLAELFVRKTCEEYGLEVVLADDAREALLRHSWPGNVRELRNVIERAVHIERAGSIGAEDLQLRSMSGRSLGHAASSLETLAAGGRTYAEIHREVDRVALALAMRRFAGNISQAAAQLEISRDRLRARLKEVGLYER